MFSFEKQAYLCFCDADTVSVRVLREMLANERIPENSRDTGCCSK